MQLFEQRIDKFKKLNALRENNHLWEKCAFQVVLCAHNEERALPSTIASIERSMRGLKWGMVFGDDGSTDNTTKVVESLSELSDADFYRVETMEKMPNVSIAKNALCKITKEYSEEYPGILFCDADDFVERDKVPGLYEVAKENNSNIVVGSWIYNNEKLKKKELKSAQESIEILTFGPWNTLIHSSLIPDDGIFWNEELEAHADLLMWWELAAAGVKFTEAGHVTTTQYNAHFGSTSKQSRVDIKQERWDKFLKYKEEVINYMKLKDS